MIDRHAQLLTHLITSHHTIYPGERANAAPDHRPRVRGQPPRPARAGGARADDRRGVYVF